jgi:DNA invertase Pin-like site-specific DNA recombinase
MRKSSEDETEKQAESIIRQKRDIASYLERNALDDEMNRLDVREEDIHHEDVSAKKLGRKEFTKVVEKIKKGRGLYKVLLCTELTRLSRNPIDNGTVVSLMDDREEKNDRYLEQVRTLDQTFRANPTDKFTLSLFLSVAKFENDMRAKNTSSGMQNRKSQGATTNRAPCGYINC